MRFSFLAILVVLFYVSKARAEDMIKIPSLDGVEIVADLYKVHADTVPFIVLFHQAGWSRGEYQEIAPQLNDQGFNCLAVDQRSGGKVNGVINQTHANAKKALKETSYLDAFQDIEAAIDLVKEMYAEGKVVIWGSSYSSSLVLKYAGDNPDAVDGILSFSPGEYFKSRSSELISSSASNINKPVFITSAKSEQNSWQEIYDTITSQDKVFFLPETSGNHGSRALWAKFSDHRDYWKAVNSFLSQFK